MTLKQKLSTIPLPKDCVVADRSGLIIDANLPKEVVSLFFEYGKKSWQAFCRQPLGRRLYNPLTRESKDRSRSLFMRGFTICCIETMVENPTISIPVPENCLYEVAWWSHLMRSRGKVLLSGRPYPQTPKPVQRIAELFFASGYTAALKHCEDCKGLLYDASFNS